MSYTRNRFRTMSDLQMESYMRDIERERRGLLAPGSTVSPFGEDSGGLNDATSRSPSFSRLVDWHVWVRPAGILPSGTHRREWTRLLSRATESAAREAAIHVMKSSGAGKQEVKVLPTGYHPDDSDPLPSSPGVNARIVPGTFPY